MSAPSSSSTQVQSMSGMVNNDIKKPASSSNKTLAIVLFIIAALGVAGSAYWLGDGNFGKGFSDNALGYGIAAAIVGGVSIACAIIYLVKHHKVAKALKATEDSKAAAKRSLSDSISQDNRRELAANIKVAAIESGQPLSSSVPISSSIAPEISSPQVRNQDNVPSSSRVSTNVSTTPSTTVPPSMTSPIPTPSVQTPPSNVPSLPTASTSTPLPPPQRVISSSSTSSATPSTSSTPHVSSKLAVKADTMNAAAENMVNLTAQLPQPVRVKKTGKNADWRRVKSYLTRKTGIGRKKTPAPQSTQSKTPSKNASPN